MSILWNESCLRLARPALNASAYSLPLIRNIGIADEPQLILRSQGVDLRLRGPWRRRHGDFVLGLHVAVQEGDVGHPACVPELSERQEIAIRDVGAGEIAW